MNRTTDDIDDRRRQWISEHKGVSLIQRRRAEILGRDLHRRRRSDVLPSPDQHEDEVTPPLWQRGWHTPADHIEVGVVVALAFIAPIGWAAARGLSNYLTTLIRHQRLNAYPLAVLFGSSAALGVFLPMLYDPPATFTGAVMVPWIIGQFPATLLGTALYGIAEGWLAIPESEDWLPLQRPEPDVVPLAIIESDDQTPPLP